MPEVPKFTTPKLAILKLPALIVPAPETTQGVEPDANDIDPDSVRSPGTVIVVGQEAESEDASRLPATESTDPAPPPKDIAPEDTSPPSATDIVRPLPATVTEPGITLPVPENSNVPVST